MKPIGIGVDIVDTKRFKLCIKNKKFMAHIRGKNEILNKRKIVNKINFLSKRFAAKEALAKALGTGFRNGLNFKDIEILNDRLGKPYYVLNIRLKNQIKKKKRIKNFNLFLSISDEKDYSIAFTMIQSV